MQHSSRSKSSIKNLRRHEQNVNPFLYFHVSFSQIAKGVLTINSLCLSTGLCEATKTQIKRVNGIQWELNEMCFFNK